MSRNCSRIEHSAPCPQSAFPSCWDIARRAGHEPKRLQRREFRPFFDTFRLSYLAGCQIVCCHSDRKCAEPATNRWNNYDCVGKFTKRELSKIQLLAAIQPIFDAQVCHWTYEAWITHRVLFDDNPNGEELRHSKYGPLLGRLSNITADYALLQLAKLHDR